MLFRSLRINLTVFGRRPSAYACPSDPSHATVEMEIFTGLKGSVGLANYCGVAGAPFRNPSQFHGFFKQYNPNALAGDPALQPPSPVAMKHVVDGTSKTLYALERIARFVTGSPNSLPANRFTMGTMWYNGAPPGSSCGCFATSGNPANMLPLGLLGYLELPPLVSPEFGVNPQNPGEPSSLVQRSASSYHPAGVNGLLADGSVHFFSDSIDQRVLNALTTIAVGDDAGAF